MNIHVIWLKSLVLMGETLEKNEIFEWPVTFKNLDKSLFISEKMEVVPDKLNCGVCFKLSEVRISRNFIYARRI